MEQKQICVYPGSFDPMTVGHLDVVKRASGIFDEVHLGVLDNANKQNTFSVEERVDMIQRCTDAAGLGAKCSVWSFTGLTVDFARRQEATAILRGLRATADFEYEWQMALMNRRLAPEIETVLLMTDSRYMYLSSSLVRDLAYHGQDISEFVPAAIVQDLQQRFGQK